MEQDIIINYTEKDNESKQGKNGWISDFTHFLTIMLTQVLGEEPKIIIKSEGSALSVSELKNTGILISILSPYFIHSTQCLDAIEEFYKANEASAKKRLFKVLKTNVPYDEQPDKLKDALPYELFDLDYDSGNSVIFDDYFGPAAENVYWMKMVDLAYDVHESLIMLRNLEKQDGVKPLYKRDTIFLAETSQDLNVQRNVIRRELQRHGYRVLPDHTLPRDAETAEKVIAEELAESIMSVHLIGNSYGDLPAGGDRSIVDMENKLAAEKVRENPSDRRLQRLIWINPHQESSNDQQKNFIENIQRDLSTLEAAEIFQIPLEDFKNTLREELFDKKERNGETIEEIKIDEKKNNVYLIYDKIDQDEAITVSKELIKAGVNVLHTDFDGNVLALRKLHLEKLKLLDIGIVFKGKVNDNWVRMKLLDLLKAPGLGRDKPILGKAVIGGMGIEMRKELYEDFDLELLSMDKKDPLANQIDKFIKGLNKAI
jgi:Domain of unknown function (DUF4062)